MSGETQLKTVISYRSDDAGGWSVALFNVLSAKFGEKSVFIDFEGVPLGRDFENIIIETINGCDALLVLIGRRWLDARNEKGTRKLDDEDDIVRFEIRTGLERALVIPVLFEGAPPPQSHDLPEDIRGLARLNPHRISSKTFGRDVEDLVEEIRVAKSLAREKKESVSAELRIQALEQQLANAIAERDAALKHATARAHKAFDAYIVYSHQDNARLATILQKALEKHGQPGEKLRIFRDTTDLAASPSVFTSIQAAVDNSAYLILLASPASAQSAWVERELSWFLRSRSADNVLTVLTDGESDAALPRALQHALNGREPLFVDFRGLAESVDIVRNERFTRGVDILVAAIRNMPLREVAGRERAVRRRARAVITIAMALITMLLAVVGLLIRARLAGR